MPPPDSTNDLPVLSAHHPYICHLYLIPTHPSMFLGHLLQEAYPNAPRLTRTYEAS